MKLSHFILKGLVRNQKGQNRQYTKFTHGTVDNAREKAKVTTPFFAARVRALRKLRQMTQTEFGASLNRHYHSVVNWERGHTKPSMKTIGEIGRIYNVSVDWLLGRSNEMEVNQK